MNNKRITIKINNKILVIGVLFLFVAIIVRIFFIVYSPKVDGINLAYFANNRNTVKKTLYANRGQILDTNGELLASNITTYTLIAYLNENRTTDINNPLHVVDKEYTASILAKHIDMSEENILKILNKEAYQVEFGTAGKLKEDEKKKISELKLPGISFISSITRYYKMGTMAPYIIGYAKYNDDGEINGEMGIELQYNDELKGINGEMVYQKDAKGYQIPNTPSYTKESKSGSDIYLTIDTNLQMIIDNQINEFVSKYKLEWLNFTVMDSHTGAIVASSVYPSFNENDLNTITNYLNPLVSYQFEPGSTMKIFSFMAAMENEMYNGSDKYESGCIKVSDVTICDFNDKGWGSITFDKGFAYSSNTASSNLALNLGVSKLTNFYKKMGFGYKTGIELPNEGSGKINFTYKSELANASFGQGITVTPIQMLQALTTITNKGVMLKPYLIEKIVDNDNKVLFEGKRKEIGEKISEETVTKIQTLMTDVVYNGLSKQWQPNSVKLMAKTGTAQIAGNNGYLTGEYNTIKSLAGIFPSEDPKYIIYTSIKKYEGQTKNYSSFVTSIIDTIANYKNLTNKEENKTESKVVLLPNLVNKNVTEVSNYLIDKKIVPIIIGNGKVVTSMNPNSNSRVLTNSKVFIKTNDSNYKMPDITMWSTSEVISFCNLIKLPYNLNGYGYVKSFNFEVGETIDYTKTLEIILE